MSRSIIEVTFYVLEFFWLMNFYKYTAFLVYDLLTTKVLIMIDRDELNIDKG